MSPKPKTLYHGITYRVHCTQVREVYERAVANVPPAPAKRYWQRYIYLWLKYALWEELGAGEPARAREVYRACLKVIPHAAFTFAKARLPAHAVVLPGVAEWLWIPYALQGLSPVKDFVQHMACSAHIRQEACMLAAITGLWVLDSSTG